MNFNRYGSSGSSSVEPIAIISFVALAGAVMFFFMPSVLNKIRKTTDLGATTTPPGPATREDAGDDDSVEDASGQGVLSDNDNNGVV